MLVATSIGDYRSGDEIWCDALGPTDYGKALNRDVLIPRPAGRFMFGRLINRDDEKLQILPLEAGGRQQVVADPPWLGVAQAAPKSLTAITLMPSKVFSSTLRVRIGTTSDDARRTMECSKCPKS